MRVSILKALAAGILAWALLAGMSLVRLESSALALTSHEAGTVVTILEKLKAQGADIAYDDDAADDWFERDTDEQKLITKAGFTQKTWKTAVDETMKGFFATIPETEIKSIFDGLRKRIDLSKATAQQKQTILEMWDEQRKQMVALRAQGKPFADMVSPFAARLRKLTFDSLTER